MKPASAGARGLQLTPDSADDHDVAAASGEGTGQPIVGASTPTTLRTRVQREAALVGLATLLLAVASFSLGLPTLITSWSQTHLGGLLDDVVLLLAGSHLFMLVFGARRARDLKGEFAQRHAAEAELRHRARHDGLTGLLNRTALGEELEAALASSSGGEVTALLIDLDRFKEVNDTLGHPVGDRLLQAVAERLSAEVRDCTSVARLGGDEFVLLLDDCTGDDAREVATRLREALRRPFQVDEFTLEVDGSIGLASSAAGLKGDDVATRVADLLRQADVAMYVAKAEHSGVAVYDPRHDGHDEQRLSLYGELRRGIGNGELRLHYQPQVALDGRVVGMEALVRWEHPSRGLLMPGDFIELAERTGLVHELTVVVLAQAVADCATWRRDGRNLSVAVNLSVRSLYDPDLPDRIGGLLATHALDPAALELEITESAAMQDPQRAVQVLRRLRALGVGLALDDFGTGHASLAHLARLPVSTLKIDRSFVSTMELDDTDRAIVRSTIELAHNLGLRVVAEGVETRSGWLELRALGCDEAQGFWLGRPAPVTALADQVAAVAAVTGEVAIDGPAGPPATR